MAIYSILVFFVVSILLVLHSAASCPSSIECKNLELLKFPFTNASHHLCGLCTVTCDDPFPRVMLGLDGKSFRVSGFTNDTIKIEDPELKPLIDSKNCSLFSYFDRLNTPSISFAIITPSITLFKCHTRNHEHKLKTDVHFPGFYGNDTYKGCLGYTVYHTNPNQQVSVPNPDSYPSNCEAYHLPMLQSVEGRDPSDAFSLLASNFYIGFHVSEECKKCFANGGQCLPRDARDALEFQCSGLRKGGRSNLALILGPVIAGVIFFLCLVIIGYRKKLGNYISSYTIWRNSSSDPSSKEDLEGGSVYFGVPVFSYSELEEATHNFDPSQVLGDGGFGTVYLGKLQDGREVAVKRLYEHNYKRVAQFLNEIEILTRLRHRNLVTLYGCTSRYCRELILVYEYIPNGTVADHLHGDRAKDHPLSWPTRMNIAVETASALVYLHASDIIHRDVKTNNILLDNNFGVKVADFGLSRLFPNDVSHISTAPQGTPGYVDPEYHQCYQLTDRSDVYSFGVVLIELISSLPAVDINRHRHEINLANLAMTRIQNGAFNELIDPSLGFESDSAVERMTTSVAEVAFQCLQLEREMRPTMDEVFEALKEIQEYEDEKIGKMSPPSLDRDNIGMLNSGKAPPSPDSATNRWVNSSITSTSSG